MKKLLIADDETHIRLLLEEILEELEDMGVEMFFAENGREALEIITEEKPDLVFLDVMMPEMDGFSVCRAVKQDLKLTMHIALVTAKGQEVDKLKGTEVGADNYITKPFIPSEVMQLARSVLGV